MHSKCGEHDTRVVALLSPKVCGLTPPLLPCPKHIGCISLVHTPLLVAPFQFVHISFLCPSEHGMHTQLVDSLVVELHLIHVGKHHSLQ